MEVQRRGEPWLRLERKQKRADGIYFLLRCHILEVFPKIMRGDYSYSGSAYEFSYITNEIFEKIEFDRKSCAP